MKALKIGLIIVVLGLLSAAYVWFFVYNKPHRDFEKARPDVVESARQCYRNFKKSAKAPESGKVVELSGVPKAIEHSDSLVTVVFAFQQGMFGDEGVRCTLLPQYNQEAGRLSLHDTVRIKGFCSGYNGTDVILEEGSLVHN